MKKWVIISVVAVALIAVAYPLFFKGKKKEAVDPATISAREVVRRGDLSITVSATGKIEPIKTVELRSKASGEIIKLLVEEGDVVKKGQVVCELERTTALNDYRQAQADFDVAKASLDISQKELDRQKELFSQKLSSDRELEIFELTFQQAKSQLTRAEANLSTTKERLDDTVLRSPMNGVVIKKYVEAGQVIASGISSVSGGTLIAVIGDISSVYIQADVDETDIGKVETGQPIRVTADAFPDREFSGRVERVAPMGAEVQNVTTFKVTSQVRNPQGLLKAGMNATVEIVAADKRNVLLIPAEAVKEPREMMQFMAKEKENGGAQASPKPDRGNFGGGDGAKKKFAFVIKDGKPQPVPIEVGVSNFDYAEVKSGLSEGDSILVVSVSQMMQDREFMKERFRQFRQLPGVKKQ